MESIAYRLNRYVSVVRSFLTRLYSVSDKPGCGKLSDEEFRGDIRRLKEGPDYDAEESTRGRPPN